MTQWAFLFSIHPKFNLPSPYNFIVVSRPPCDKRAVLSVLEDELGERVKKHPHSETNENHNLLLPDISSKLCQIVLRHIASLFDSFCNFFPSGICDSSSSIFRLFDFRSIDCKLAVKAYGGSHAAFCHDVQELWENIRTYDVERHYMVQLADTFTQLFDLAYEKEVVDVVRKLSEYSKSNSVSTEALREVENIIKSVEESKIPDAPWNSDICKVCSIDKDDDCLLLCDICGGEYHLYCLEPPLDTVPKGDWYCPLCVSPEAVAKNASHVSELPKQLKEEESENFEDQLQCVTCEVCDDRGSTDDMLSCHICEISFVHRLCYLGENQISAEDVKWVCEDCQEV